MNTALREQIRKVEDKHDVLFMYQGNFTICLIQTRRKKDKEVLSWGVAKCNPADDVYLTDRGEDIALARAVKSLRDNKRGNWIEG